VHRGIAVAGSLVFFVVAPGFVADLVPRWITRWQVREPLPHWLPFRVLGAVLLASGAAVLVHAFGRFVVEGAGTPAPVAPPRHLVVGGLYRYVRNPMYLAIIDAIAGQALLLGQLQLLLYAGAVFLACAAFVLGYEQPTLKQRFGAEYEAYCRAVPAWWPRLRPWMPMDADRS
jgi:protein-S-isoprenylcysteine O-methyltransferase Ste14